MTEQQATHHHHKIKAEWTKASNNEIYGKDKDGDCKIKIIEQVVIFAKKNSKKAETKKCGICEKSFSTDGTFQEHEKTHENSFFECPEENCNKQFKRKSSLRKHLYDHRGRFKYSCKDCQETFVDRVKYEIHLASKHKKIERIFECQECQKTFSSSDYLKKHQVTHRDEYKYTCKTCNQKFKWLTSLQSHVLIHTQNKATLQCKECLKCFFNSRTLDRHRKIHQFVKFQCSICITVSSKRRDNILRHIRHLHQEIPKSEVIKHVKVIEEKQTNVEHAEIDDHPLEEIEIDDDDSNVLIIDESKQDEPEEVIEPPVIVSNRVNVIQSIGNPNKNVTIEKSQEEINQKTTKTQKEIQLPPKKKATANRYNPIEQYRRIFGLDAEKPATEQSSSSKEENQVFPDHWRKRTSLLFRR